MTHHVTNNFKKVALGLVALFALAFLPSCWFDTNNCYTEAYIVCDNGVEFVQTEYCTPYRDFWGNWYEECVYDGYYQQNCWTDYRCVDAPQCWTDADCKGARACVNNRCETYKFPPNNNGGNGNNGNNGGNNNNTQTCSTDNDCGTNGVCVDYGNYKSCAQSCLNNSHCSTAMSANSCQTTSRRAPASIAVIRAIKPQTAPVAWYAQVDLAKFRAIAAMTALSVTRATLASVGIAIRN